MVSSNHGVQAVDYVLTPVSLTLDGGCKCVTGVRPPSKFQGRSSSRCHSTDEIWHNRRYLLRSNGISSHDLNLHNVKLKQCPAYSLLMSHVCSPRFPWNASASLSAALWDNKGPVWCHLLISQISLGPPPLGAKETNDTVVWHWPLCHLNALSPNLSLPVPSHSPCSHQPWSTVSSFLGTGSISKQPVASLHSFLPPLTTSTAMQALFFLACKGVVVTGLCTEQLIFTGIL